MISHKVPWPDLTEPLEPLHGKKVANFQFTFSNCQFGSIHQVVFKRSTPEEFCDGLTHFLDGETQIFCPRVAQEEVFLTIFSYIFQPFYDIKQISSGWNEKKCDQTVQTPFPCPSRPGKIYPSICRWSRSSTVFSHEQTLRSPPSPSSPCMLSSTTSQSNRSPLFVLQSYTWKQTSADFISNLPNAFFFQISNEWI